MTKAANAWGWLAAGVLAMGVNGFMHDDGADMGRRIADRVISRSGVVASLASGRADWVLARTRTLAVREQTQSCGLGPVIARIESQIAARQSEFARVEQMSAREQAQLARMEANRARIEARAVRVQLATADFETPIIREFSAPRAPVICPRGRVNIPRPLVRIPVPVVHVKTLGAGSV